jgi:hypothetical protein
MRRTTTAVILSVLLGLLSSLAARVGVAAGVIDLQPTFPSSNLDRLVRYL